MEIILLIILSHWFADFFLQSYNMSVNKSKSIYWLTIHINTYIYGLIPLMIYLLYFRMFTLDDVIIFLCLNYVFHWVTDFVTSKINTYLWNKKEVHWFFVSIGVDQVIHYLCLFLTYNYLTSQPI